MKTDSCDKNKHMKMKEMPHQPPQDWEEIFNTITDIITIHDKDFNIIHANNAAKEVLNLPELMMNRAIKCFSHYHGTEGPPEGCPSCDCVNSGVPAVFELFEPHLNKHVEIRAMPRFNENKEIIGVIHIARDITHRKESEEQLKNSREKLRNLTAHLHYVREEERKHIAREIHDELAQSLTALKMDLVWVNNKLLDNQKPLLDKTRRMSNLIDRTIYAVRRISSELRPGLLDDLGLQAAMEWQVKEFVERTGITCDVDFYSETDGLDPERATTVFRIFQETLTNIVRHAEATRVKASLEEIDNALIMKVKDNGIGITKEQMSDPKTFGLMGIQERAHLWGGKVAIFGTAENGTTVKVIIPLAK